MKQETKRRVAACTAGFALPRYEELPQVGLYLDQTVQYVNGFFTAFPGVELTLSMVSNYVKKGVLDHPIKKRYTREQIAALIYIVVVKTVLSLENIDTLLKMQREHCAASTAYNSFCTELEISLYYVFGLQPDLSPLPEQVTDERFLMRSTIFAAANKMYLDCCFQALSQEKSLWPAILPDLQ